MVKLQSVIYAAVLGIVILTVLFESYAEITPEVQTSGDKLDDEYQCETAASTTCFWNASRTTDCTENNVTTADTTACTTYKPVPLGGLFSGSGVILIVVMCALLVLVVRAFLPGGKK